jgi:hypothetical protein
MFFCVKESAYFGCHLLCLKHFVVFLPGKKVPIWGVIYYVKPFCGIFVLEKSAYFGCHLLC